MPTPQVIEINGSGPEDVVVDHQGGIISGVADGRLLRVSPDGRRIDTVAETGGRPLGIELLPDERLLVCDARRGLLRVCPRQGQVDVLVDEVAGQPLRFCNNAAVATDGTVYFSDSSQRFGLEHWVADILEHSGTGRLLRRDPTGNVEVLLTGLQFANGVALAPDESFVVVAESGAHRLTRLWLTGPRAGTTDVLADNLPGFPDNVSTGTDGLIWVALASPRNAILDRLCGLRPVFRQALWALPDALLRIDRRTVWVIALDANGRVVHDLQNSASNYHMVTGVREHHGLIYLGSLEERAIAVIDTR
jgi:sugar lactone lactonase YvrE